MYATPFTDGPSRERLSGEGFYEYGVSESYESRTQFLFESIVARQECCCRNVILLFTCW
jgi:hypothetical protein